MSGVGFIGGSYWTHTFRCDGCETVLDTETQRLREAHEIAAREGWKCVQTASGGMREMKQHFCLECAGGDQ